MKFGRTVLGVIFVLCDCVIIVVGLWKYCTYFSLQSLWKKKPKWWYSHNSIAYMDRIHGYEFVSNLHVLCVRNGIASLLKT
jgi:hypothetical protein